MSQGLSLLDGLRRRGDEAQLTQALASVFRADGAAARQFLRLALQHATGRTVNVPESVRVSAEEVSTVGRFDLRFRSLGWDVLIELKIHAGYGKGQLKRYLTALEDVENAYLLAVTRDVPLYGEPPPGFDRRWLGSLRWRELRQGLREMQFDDDDLRRQWPLFLEVLEWRDPWVSRSLTPNSSLPGD